MKTVKKAMSVIIAVMLVFGCFASPALIVEASAATTVTGDVSDPVSGFTSFINTLKNFFTSISLMFSRMSGESADISAENHTQFSLAQEGDTIRLTADISAPEIFIGSAINLDLNGHTITANRFTYNTNSSLPIYICNGTIYTTRGDININAPNTTIDIDSVTFAVNGSAQQISADTAMDTLLLRNGTRFIDVNESIADLNSAISSGSNAVLSLYGDSRAVLDSSLSHPINIRVAAVNVIIENHSNNTNNTVTIGNGVSGNVSILNYGQLASVVNERNALVTVTNSGTIAYLRNSGAFSMNYSGTSPASHEGQLLLNGVSIWRADDDLAWYDSSLSVYTLSDAADFAGMYRLYRDGNDFAGKTIYLTTSIDLIDMPTDLAVDTVFRGTFDAKGNTFYNLHVALEEYYDNGQYALFPKTENATIRNCNFSNASVTCDNVTASNEATQGTALLVGFAGDNTIIENCNVTSSAIGKDSCFNHVCTGFIVGNAAGAGISVNNCSITDSYIASSNKYIGGIVGKLNGYADAGEALPIISNCSVTGTRIISAANSSEGGYAGGIAGAVYLGTVNACTVDGATVSASSQAGGLIGEIGIISGRPVLFTEFRNTITNSSVKNTSIIISGKNAGGFAGSITHSNYITDCYVENSTLTVTDGFRGSFGGFAGKNAAETVFTRCHVNGMTISLDSAKNITAAAGFVGTNSTGQQNTANSFASFYSHYNNCVTDNIKITSANEAVNLASEGGFAGNADGAYFTSCFVKRAELGIGATAEGKFCANALAGSAYISADGSAPYGQCFTFIENCIITGPVSGAEFNIATLSDGCESNL